MRLGNLYSTLLNTAKNVKGLGSVRAVLLAGILVFSVPAIAQNYTQVSNTSGTSVVNGITVTVTSSGTASSASGCSSPASPYLLSNSGDTYTFTFSAPVGSILLNTVFGNSGVAGDVHFVRNGTAYSITTGNLGGTVGTCSPGVLAVASGGDLTNTGNLSSNANNVVLIPGPITTLIVQSNAAADALFGLFFTPSTYYQVTNTGGTSTIDGVTTTVTSGGSVGAGTLCSSTTAAPYYLNGGAAGDFNFSFSSAVDGINVPSIFTAGGVATSVSFTVNGTGVSITSANLNGLSQPHCADNTEAVISGGNLTNSGDVSGNPSANVMLNGSATSLVMSVSASGNGFLNGIFFTKGTTAAMTFNNASPQTLNTCNNSSPTATSINSLLALTDLNSGSLALTWSIVVSPSHGSLSGFPFTAASTGGSVTPSGLSYTPTASYSGADAFSIQVSDGVNTATTTINVNDNIIPVVTTITPSVPTPPCQGAGAIVDVSGSLANGTYTVNYTLTGGNTGSGSASMAFSGGGGSFTTSALANATSTTITLNSISSGTGCSSALSSTSTTTTPSGLPTAYTVGGGGTYCTGGSGVDVTLSDAVPGVNYQLNYLGSPLGASQSGGFTGLIFGPVTGAGSYSVIATNATSGCQSTMSGTAIVSVNPAPAAITGTLNVCVGSTTTLSDASGSGTWASSNTGEATVGSSSGIVAGTGAGNPTISFTLTSTGCIVTTPITVNALPVAYSVTISNGGHYCAGGTGATIGVANTESGVNYELMFGASGVAGPVAGSAGSPISFPAQTAAGSYSVVATNTTTGCTDNMTGTVNVVIDALPASIGGTLNVCVASTTNLTDGTAGGEWSSSNTSLATIGSGSGIATGVAAGNPIITFTVISSGCFTTSVLTVNPLPSAIGGTLTVCPGLTTTLTSSPTPGAWTSNSTGQATVGSSSGIVTGVSAGTPTITYMLPTGCMATAVVTVNPLPAAIGANVPVCVASTTTLTESSSGGSWSSNNTSLATIGSSSAMVTGVATGNPVISYTLPTGCYITAIATVNPLPAAIGGTPVVCAGLTTTLSDGSGGGNWTSGNTGVATIGSSSGTITGVTNGNANITYTLPTGCMATTIATVNPLPASITGTTNVCVSSTTTLSTTSTGGLWSSSNFTLASVGSNTGIVTGVASGTPTITYTLPTGCITTTPVTVNPLPLAIAGVPNVCVGLTTSLSDAIGGGTWTSSIPAEGSIGSVSGIVTGIAPGTTLITYTLPTGCIATTPVTINSSPATIGANAPVCVGSTITLSESSSGGSWSSSDITKATVGSGSGVVTGVGAGNPTITYALPTGCINTTVLTVNAVPVAITGTMSVCIGLTTTLADATTGGSWSSSNTGQATVGSTSGVVTGVASGNPIISYTLPVTGCYALATATVNSLPGTITGTAVVCVGGSSSLGSTPSGGTWSSSNPGQATVGSSSGVITGVGAGNPTITYTLPTGCIMTIVATVNPLPVAIGGAPSVCTGATTTLSDATPGGTWISSNTGLATIGSTTGFVNGISTGVDNITYTLTTTGCYITTPFTVNPTPTAITGTTNVCVGLSTPLFDGTGGGAWSSSNATYATANSSTGVVTGVSSGVPTITYTLSTGCYITTPVTVNPLPGAISGTMSICPGTTTSLADGTPGGSWSSSNTSEATVGSTGIVTGMAAGVPVITYTIPTGCIATAQITVNPLPASITGASSVCTGFTTTLGSTPSGGMWSSSNTSQATVGSATGIVTGVASGTPTITYTLPTGCIITAAIVVNPTPVAIGGTMTVCTGLTTTLTNASPGGTWSSSNTSQATVGTSSGTVTGVAAGMPVISYTSGAGCYALATITVNNVPAAITGLSAVCTGSTIGLTDATTGGSWSSSNITYATVGSSSGVVTGVAAGTATITYTLPTGCIAVYAITVNQTPDAITGTASVCTGLTTTLADGLTGGSWSSSNTAEATVGSGSGTVTGVAAGTPTITYSSSAGCIATIVVTVNQTPVATTGITSVCVGLTSTLSDATTGGTWTSSNTSQATIGSSTGIITGISTGTPTITYTMPTGCNIVIPITVNPTPAAITGTTVVCAGSSTTLSDGTGGGTWSSGNTSVATVVSSTGAVTGVSAGTCSIIYTLGAGCTATITYTVNAVPNVTSFTSPSATSVCQGANSVVTVNSSSLGSGTYTVNYNLSGANTATGSAATLTMGGTGTGTFTIPSSALLFTGSTTVTITSLTNGSGCASTISSSNTSTFNVYILPTVYSVTGGGGYCAGGTGVHVYLSGSVTGINYQLYLGGSPVGAPLAGASSGLDFGLQTATGSYTVVATNTTTSCTSNMSGSVSVSVNPLPTATYTVTGGGAYCSGGSGVAVGLSNSDAGIDYQLYNGVTATGTPAVGSGSALSFGLQTASGVYTVVATNTTTLCTSNMTGSATVTVNPLPSAISGTMFVCVGSTTTLSDAGSGTWSSSNTSQATVVSGTGVISGVASGTPTITYTLPTGCLTSTVITVNSLPSAIAGPGTVCTGLAITLTDPTGGGSWSSSNTSLATASISSGVVTGVASGTPFITYTLATGCMATTQVTVNPSPAAITGTTTVCTGLTTTLSDATTGGMWTSSIATEATVGSSSGVVTGVATGTPNITYTLAAGCFAITPVTVNPTPASITGVTNVCVGLTTTLGDASGSGTWSSSNTSLAVVGVTSGVVTGIASGTVTITYTLPAGCTAVTNVTVNPSPAAISGTSNVCVGLTTTLSDAVSGGTWTSSNTAIGTVDPSLGIVMGISAGAVTITYTLPAGCNTVYSVVVNPLPSSVTGVANVCMGSTTTLGDATTGGSWSSSNTSLATIGSGSGVVSGIASGTPIITYTLLTGCIATTPVTVNPLPPATSGSTTVCAGSTITLSDASGGGTWSSSNTALATVVSGTGVVTGVASGNPTITYTLSTGCITTTAITVNPSPASITGSSNVCLGLTSTLADATSGGSWTSSNTSLATVGSATGVVTGVATGTAFITYTLPAGCTATLLVTVSPQPASIVGVFTVCSGQTTTLSSTSGGGTWSSSNAAVATVGSSTGVVTGVTSGTVIMTYTLSGGCLTTASITVNPTPAAISGNNNVCAGLTTVLSDLSSGGAWSSSTSAATIGSSSGIVTGVTAGAATITYMLPAGCYAILPFTVNPLPSSITGTMNVCVGLTTTLSDASSGGTWSGSNSLVATVGSSSGIVTGVSAGTLTITYTLSTGCINTTLVTVNALPGSFSLTGGGAYCSGGAGVDIGLGGSASGISYQLMLSGSASGFAVAGTGSAIDFGNRTGAGTYTVVATNTTTSCTSNMASSVIVVVNPLPTTYNMTGGGSFCSGGAGVPVGLNGSNSGINYQLYYSGTTVVGTPASGTGSSITFPNVYLSGAYTAVATNPVTTCSIAMLGSATVTVNPLPTAYTVTGGGSYCAGGTGVHVGLSNSTSGVNYELFVGGTLLSTLPGSTGSSIDFGAVTGIGTYTVYDTNVTTHCTSFATGSVAVTTNPIPVASSLTGGGTYCSGGSGVHIGVASAQSGVNYQLYLGTSAVGSPVTGITGALDLGLQLTPTTATSVYTVVGVNATNSCSNNMTGSITVSVNPLPLQDTVTGGGSYCLGGTGVQIGVSPTQTATTYTLLGGSGVNPTVTGTGSHANFPSLTTVAGTYTVVASATTGSLTCTVNMLNSVVVNVNIPPNLYSVTGGGSYCSGTTSTIHVGIGSSDLGVNYQLYLGGSVVGSPMAGTGSSLDFGAQTAAGVYTVIATNTSSSCASNMLGSATVAITTLPPAYPITGGGSYCSGGTGVPMGLGNSTTGVSYQLYDGTTAVGSPILGSTGTPLNFGLQTAGGIYSIIGTATPIATGCSNTMSGTVTVTILGLPATFSVSGGGRYCAGSAGVPVNLSGSATGYNYQVYNGTSIAGAPVAGTGAALSLGLQTAPGRDSVVAINPTTGCKSTMTGIVTVSVSPLPIVDTVTGGGGYCAGSGGVLVGLSNSTPGISYQLYSATGTAGSPVAGTGSTISFGLHTTAGIRTAIARDTVTGCTNPMYGSVSVSVNPLPNNTYMVTGGGSYCTGGSGVVVGLSSSDPGVNYQLMIGSSVVGAAVPGTGYAISFGLQTSLGIYQVVGSNAATTCSSVMTGTQTVSISAPPTAYNVLGGGGYCLGTTGVAITLSNSSTGVSYQLYLGSTPVGSAVAGTGSAISFGSQTATGTYKVVATSAATSCTNNMTGTAIVSLNTLPTAYNVTGGGGYCAGGTGVALGLNGSTTAISYQLMNGSSPVGAPLAGTGSALSFGLQTLGGVYTVVATNVVTGCNSNMTGSASVTINPLPLVYAITGGGPYCAGDTGVHIGTTVSDMGVNYQLYKGSSMSGGPVAGTGSPLDFGLVTAAGTYTVVASDAVSGCSSNLSGAAVVTINSLPTAYAITGGGSYCAGGTGLHVWLGGSNAGVDYQLYDGTLAVGAPVGGTGAVINFGAETAGGTYTVVAYSPATGCSSNMTGSAMIVVNPLPFVDTVIGGGGYCPGGTGVHIGLSNSTAGVDYQLMRGTTAVDFPVSGTNTGLDFGLQTIVGAYAVVATDSASGCSSNMSGIANVSISPLPTAYTFTGSSIGYCAGAAGVDLKLSSSDFGTNYQLYLGSVAMGSPVAGTGVMLDFGMQTTAGTYSVMATNSSTGCSSNMTGTPSITISPLPTVNTVTGGGSYCAGGAGIHIGLSGSTSGINYQLYKGAATFGAIMPGTGYSLDFGADTAAGTYTIVATDPTSGCSVNMLSSAAIAINPLPAVYFVTGGASYCAGGAGAHIGLSASDSGVNYQLYDGTAAVGSVVTGATGMALDFGAYTAAGSYNVVATNAITTCVSSMAGSAVIAINPTPTLFAVTGGGNYCVGGSGVHVGIAGSSSGINYQLWNGATGVGSAMPGSSAGSSVDFGLQTVAGTYKVVAANATTGCSDTMTGSAVVTISSLPNVYPVTGGGSYCATLTGADVALSHSDSGINYRLYNAGSAVGAAIGGGTGSSLDFGLQPAGVYTVVAINASTTCSSNMSGSAVVTEIPSVAPGVTVSTSAGSDTVCAGSLIMFNVSPTNGGATPTYQWYVNGLPAGAGGTSFDYTPANGNVISVTMTSDATCVFPATATGLVAMTVRANLTPSVTITVSPKDTVCQGSVVTFTATAVNGGATPSYVWEVNGSAASSGPTYAYAPMNGDVVFCILNSDYPCLASNFVLSNNVHMTVDSSVPPVVTISNNSGADVAGVLYNDTLTATVSPANSSYTYQWSLNGSAIAGANAATYMAASLQNDDDVSCVVSFTNACGLISGSKAYLITAYDNVGVKTVTNAVSDIKLVPNPNKGVFTIKGTLGTTTDQEVTIEITDILGQTVYTKKANAQGGTINESIELGSSIANGMYIVTLHTDTENKVFHMVIEQ